MVILPLNKTTSFCCLVFSATRLHLTSSVLLLLPIMTISNCYILILDYNKVFKENFVIVNNPIFCLIIASHAKFDQINCLQMYVSHTNPVTKIMAPVLFW